MTEVKFMDFSQKVRYVREKLNMSQEDLARALNVSYATINRWENSKNKPVKMAQAAFNDFCNKHSITFDDISDK
jgi:Predicted transcriptional regulator